MYIKNNMYVYYEKVCIFFFFKKNMYVYLNNVCILNIICMYIIYNVYVY